MATVRSNDGKEIVWCVFNCDGYECSDLVGIFDSPEEAEKCRFEYEKAEREFHAFLFKDYDEGEHEWMGSVEVHCVEVNKYETPYTQVETK